MLRDVTNASVSALLLIRARDLAVGRNIVYVDFDGVCSGDDANKRVDPVKEVRSGVVGGCDLVKVVFWMTGYAVDGTSAIQQLYF